MYVSRVTLPNAVLHCCGRAARARAFAYSHLLALRDHDLALATVARGGSGARMLYAWLLRLEWNIRKAAAMSV